MDWLSTLLQLTRDGVRPDVKVSLDVDKLLTSFGSQVPRTLGTVPLRGHGGLSAMQFASAGASIEHRPGLVTVDDVQSQRERVEAFVERVAADVQSRNLGGSYWDLQHTEVDPTEEQYSLAAEMDRLDRVEGAAVVGWVIRNAALRTQRPITSVARASQEASADALALAETLLDSRQRLDPTDGGFVFSLRPRRDHRLRSHGRFGHLWIYGD